MLLKVPGNFMPSVIMLEWGGSVTSLLNFLFSLPAREFLNFFPRNEPACDPQAGLDTPISPLGAALLRAVGSLPGSPARCRAQHSPSQARSQSKPQTERAGPKHWIPPERRNPGLCCLLWNQRRNSLFLPCSGSHLLPPVRLGAREDSLAFFLCFSEKCLLLNLILEYPLRGLQHSTQLSLPNVGNL